MINIALLVNHRLGGVAHKRNSGLASLSKKYQVTILDLNFKSDSVPSKKVFGVSKKILKCNKTFKCPKKLVETHFSELPDLRKIKTYTNPT